MYNFWHICHRLHTFFKLMNNKSTYSSRKSWNNFWHRSARSSRTWAVPVVRSATSILFELCCDQLFTWRNLARKFRSNKIPDDDEQIKRGMGGEGGEINRKKGNEEESLEGFYFFCLHAINNNITRKRSNRIKRGPFRGVFQSRLQYDLKCRDHPHGWGQSNRAWLLRLTKYHQAEH